MPKKAHQIRSGRRNNEARGTQRGNTRGKEAQARRRQLRMEKPRVREALEEARTHNEKIDKTKVRVAGIDPDHKHIDVLVGKPARYACCGRPFVPPKQPRSPQVRTAVKKEGLPYEGDGKGEWTLGQARSMLRQGYLLTQVVRLTGYGTKWFNDMKLVDGRGVSLEDQ